MSPQFKFAIKLALTAVILGLLLRAAGLSNVVGALRGTELLYLLPMYVLVLCRATVQSTLTYTILKRVGTAVPVLRVFLANALAGFYGLVVPGDIVASFAKWKDLSNATGRKAVVFNAMVYHRLLLIVIALVIGLPALWRDNPFPQYPIDSASLIFLAAAVLFSGLLFSERFGAAMDAILERFASVLPGNLPPKVRNVTASLGLFRRIPAADHARFFLLGLATVTIMAASLWMAALALHLQLTLAVVVWLQVMLLLVRTLPITIGNLGVREALLIAVLAPYGIEPATAIAFGLLLFSREVLIAVIGGSYQVALLLGVANRSVRLPAGGRT